MNLIRLIAVSLFAVSMVSAPAVKLEFTHFFPDRMRSPETNAQIARWGKSYTWPPKTFPDRWRDDGASLMGNSYGLVYWPGEEVSVTLSGVGVQADTLTCVDVLDPARSLPARTGQPGRWTIVIPVQDPLKPYLRVYRVRALKAGTEIASRGLIVTIPASGMLAPGAPDGVLQDGTTFHEWQEGNVSPTTFMTFLLGTSARKEDISPMRNRPWGDVEGCGLKEFFYAPRAEAKGLAKVLGYTTDSYNDPSLEWNTWWAHHARGVGMWNGEWQWGPFSSMAAKSITKGRFADTRRSFPTACGTGSGTGQVSSS